MNDIFVLLGIQSWKPVLTALALPPVPWLLLMLVGARMMFWRRSLSWLVMLVSVTGLWLCCTTGVGHWLERLVLKPPPALTPDRIAELKRTTGTASNKVAIVVLGWRARSDGAGVRPGQPEATCRCSACTTASGCPGKPSAPMLFSGGIGHADTIGVSEAEIAARIAEKDYGRPLTWTETESRDTRENAVRSVAMLKPAGVTDLVLVTHGFHMPRAMRAFEAGSAASGHADSRLAGAHGDGPTD